MYIKITINRRKMMSKETIPHVGISKDAIWSPPWMRLSAAAKILYIHLKSRYEGTNNGELELTYRDMKGVKGCSSRWAVSRAFKELEKKEWIKKTR